MRPKIVVIGGGIGGLAGEVVRLGERVARQGVKRPDGIWLMCYPEEALEKGWGAGFAAVQRADLQRLLASQLDPAAIHLGARCNGFRDTPEAVTVHFADGREVKADVLIGADGVHPAVRARLFGPAPLRSRGYTGVRSLTPAGSVPLPGDGIETWGRGTRFGLAPAPGGRIIWYATWNAPSGEEPADGMRAHLRALFGAWHDPIPAVIEATPEDAIVRNDIYDRWPARTWTWGRVALVGDAIHPMTPISPRAPARRSSTRPRWPGAWPRRVTPSSTARIPAATVAKRRPHNLAGAQLRRHGPIGRAPHLRRPRCGTRGDAPVPAATPARPGGRPPRQGAMTTAPRRALPWKAAEPGGEGTGCLAAPGVGDQLRELADVDGREPDEHRGEAVVVGSVKNFSGSAASNSSFSTRLATRTASTSGLGALDFFGSIRSFQVQANPLSLPLLGTLKPKWPVASLVSGSDSATRRTSSWVAITLLSKPGRAPRPCRSPPSQLAAEDGRRLIRSAPMLAGLLRRLPHQPLPPAWERMCDIRMIAGRPGMARSARNPVTGSAAVHPPPGPGTSQRLASTWPAAYTGRAHVWRPTTPSAAMPTSCCVPLTAAAVFGP